MGLFDSKTKIVTHNGTFHSDECFAVAILKIWFERNGKNVEIIRSRDPKVIEKADIAVDVGGIYDADKGRFDHHQKIGAGSHKNGIPFASFGLVWKHFGLLLTNADAAKIIEERVVLPVDALDNGINIYETNQYNVYEYSWQEGLHALNFLEDGIEKRRTFEEAINFSEKVLKGEIIRAEDHVEGTKKTQEEILKQNDPEILVLEKYIHFGTAVSKNPKIKFVIFPDRNGKDWGIEVGRDDVKKYINRQSFPENWRGLRDNPLEEVSGIKGAIFCHRGGYFCVANSKETAIQIAKKALASSH